MLRATCAIPLYFPPVHLGGAVFYDGGIADPVPIVKSLHDGNRKNLIVLTQPDGYRKTHTRGTKFGARALHRKYPAMTEALLSRPARHGLPVPPPRGGEPGGHGPASAERSARHLRKRYKKAGMGLRNGL